MSDGRISESFMQQLARREETSGLPHPDVIWAKAELRRQWEMRQAATRWIRRVHTMGLAVCILATAIASLALPPEWVTGLFSGWAAVLPCAAALVTAACLALAWRAARPPRRLL